MKLVFLATFLGDFPLLPCFPVVWATGSSSVCCLETANVFLKDSHRFTFLGFLSLGWNNGGVQQISLRKLQSYFDQIISCELMSNYSALSAVLNA